MHSQFQVSQDYTVRPCFKTTETICHNLCKQAQTKHFIDGSMITFFFFFFLDSYQSRGVLALPRITYNYDICSLRDKSFKVRVTSHNFRYFVYIIIYIKLSHFSVNKYPQIVTANSKICLSFCI